MIGALDFPPLVFGDFASFLDHVGTKAPTWSEPSSDRDETHELNPWSGTRTYSDAMALARDGWPAGREYLTKIEHDAIALPTGTTFERDNVFDVVGCYPEIGMALSGDPECMVTIEPSPAPSPIIRIGISIFRRADIPADLVMRYGGLVISHLDALEAAGWRCELTLVNAIITHGAPSFKTEIVLKRAEHAPDKDRILFAIANPSMSRRLIFRAMETVPEMENAYSGGYGSDGSRGGVAGFDAFIPSAKLRQTKDDMIQIIGNALTSGVSNND